MEQNMAKLSFKGSYFSCACVEALGFAEAYEQ